MRQVVTKYTVQILGWIDVKISEVRYPDPSHHTVVARKCILPVYTLITLLETKIDCNLLHVHRTHPLDVVGHSFP